MRTASVFLSLPRNPLLRALVLIAGMLLLAGLLALGLIAGAAVLTVAAVALLVRRWRNGRGRATADPSIIEGEFRVVPQPQRAQLPRAE